MGNGKGDPMATVLMTVGTVAPGHPKLSTGYSSSDSSRTQTDGYGKWMISVYSTD